MKKTFQNMISNKDNQLFLVGLLTLCVLVWLLLYFIPSLFFSLFHTFLGNFILLLVILLVSSKNIRYGIILGLIFILFIRIAYYPFREGFTWSKNIQKDYIKKQSILNPGIVFDLKMLQKQASEKEVKYFMKNGYWPWSKQTQQLYKASLNANPYVRSYPEDAMKHSQTIYNEAAILQVIALQTKEGQFLMNGVEIDEKGKGDLPSGWGMFPYSSGLMKKPRNIIKCSYPKGKSIGPMVLREISADGKNKKDVNLDNIEKKIPGFHFLKGKCNPCVGLEANYSCPFELDISGNKTPVSSVWSYLWFGKMTPPKTAKQQFPILSQLKNEIETGFSKVA
jgi:hypothetical protein